MSLPYFKPENKQEIWEGIEGFKGKHPEGQLALLTIRNFNWYYNQWGPEQTERALEAVAGVLGSISGVDQLAYRNYGRWMVGFADEDAGAQVQSEIGQLKIETNGRTPVTVRLTSGKIQLNPAQVRAEIEYVTVDSLNDLFKE